MLNDSSSTVFTYLLRLGDTDLVLSQRLGELCGKGPPLEEDMALANTALDLLGQARLWLSYAGELEAKGRDEDALAFLRGDRQFCNLLLVEQPNGNYADTMVRQFFFDAWHMLALGELSQSTDPRIAGIAAKAEKEVRYHLRRSADLLVRMGDGTPLSHTYTQTAVDRLWPFSGEMFVGDGVDETLAASGLGFDPPSLHGPWLEYVREVASAATLTLPAPNVWMQKGGKLGVHTEHLGYLLAEMQSVSRSFPGARW